jgi:hypothetical protein
MTVRLSVVMLKVSMRNVMAPFLSIILFGLNLSRDILEQPMSLAL